MVLFKSTTPLWSSWWTRSSKNLYRLHSESWLIYYSFLDAQAVLLEGSLIDKSSESGIVSMHRLVQRAAIRRMSSEERENIFSLVVAILSANFPDTYSADIGHQVASWTCYERSLPHIASIVTTSEEFEIPEADSQPFAELLLRCSW